MRKLNILHLAPNFDYTCGRSKHIYLLCKYLKKLGHNIYVLTNGGDSLKRFDNIEQKYLINADFHEKNIIKSRRIIKYIRDLIEKNNIDIIHSHHRFDELISYYASKNTKCQTVVTVLSMNNLNYHIEYKSKYIIAVSNSVKNNLINKFNIFPDKIFVIPHFIENESPVDNKIEYEKDQSKYVIFSAGRFHLEKNFGILIKAVGILNDNNIIIKLIGKGDRTKEYFKLSDKFNVNLQISQPKENLTTEFVNSDLCVLPSRVDPFPFFMLESGFHCKPFIGSAVDGINELIRNEVNGLLFRSEDPIDLAEKILNFKNNVTFAKNCARVLHSEIITNYIPSKIVPEIEKIYFEIT